MKLALILISHQDIMVFTFLKRSKKLRQRTARGFGPIHLALHHPSTKQVLQQRISQKTRNWKYRKNHGARFASNDCGGHPKFPMYWRWSRRPLKFYGWRRLLRRRRMLHGARVLRNAACSSPIAFASSARDPHCWWYLPYSKVGKPCRFYGST